MSEKTPGFEEYTPSRLEWLAVRLNGMLQIVDVRGIQSYFIDSDDGKTLILVILHAEGMSKEDIDDYASRLENLARVIFRRYNWDSWVEFKVEIN